MSIAYLNGKFLPLTEARVSVLDRGFLFGDGVYEVIPVYRGYLFRLEQHLERLANSFQSIHMASPLQPEQWERILSELIKQHPGMDQSVYLQVTRGVSASRDHAVPSGIEPTVFAMATPTKPVPLQISEQGISAVTLDDIRWRLCHVKAISLLANVLLRQQAVEDDAVEAILVRDGKATEGAASNVFVIVNGLLITPPKGPFLLPGITRDLVLELAAEHSISFAEKDILATQLTTAEEIWLTSSTREIMPVTRLDGHPVGNGLPGPLWRRMNALYQANKEQLETRCC